MNDEKKKGNAAMEDDPYRCDDFHNAPDPMWCANELSEEEYLFEIVDLRHRGEVIVLFDAGFSWLIIAIAEGLLARVGAEIFEQIFEEGVKPNIVARDICLKFESILNEVLDRQKLKEAIDLIETAVINVDHYRNDRDHNRGYLEQAIQNLRLAIPTLQRLDNALGSGAFMIAAGLEMSCIQERSKWVPSDAQFLKRRANELANTARQFLPIICTTVKARYSDPYFEAPPPSGFARYWYYIDKGKRGEWKSDDFYDSIGTSGGDMAYMDRCARMSQMMKQVERDNINPMLNTISKWRGLAR